MPLNIDRMEEDPPVMEEEKEIDEEILKNFVCITCFIGNKMERGDPLSRVMFTAKHTKNHKGATLIPCRNCGREFWVWSL